MHNRTLLFLLVSLSLSGPGALRAEGNAGARSEARKLAETGDAEFSAGRCDKAIQLWQQADAKFHAPTILVRVAQCQGLLGKVVEATATMEAVARDALPAGAPAAFVEAQQRARQELPKLRARIGRVHVVIEKRDLRVLPELEIDNLKMPAAQGSFDVNPGDHYVRVTAGDATWDTTVRVGDGEAREVRVGMVADATSGPFFTQARVGYIIGGLGLGTLAVGGFFGLKAMSLSHDLDVSCGTNRAACPPEAAATLDKLRTDALVADVALGAGALLFAGGAMLVLTDKNHGSEELRVRFVPTGTGASLVGRF